MHGRVNELRDRLITQRLLRTLRTLERVKLGELDVNELKVDRRVIVAVVRRVGSGAAGFAIWSEAESENPPWNFEYVGHTYLAAFKLDGKWRWSAGGSENASRRNQRLGVAGFNSQFLPAASIESYVASDGSEIKANASCRRGVVGGDAIPLRRSPHSCLQYEDSIEVVRPEVNLRADIVVI